MMIFKKMIRAVIGAFKRADKWSSEEDKKIYIEQGQQPKKAEEIHSVWDYLKFKENTQAFHLSSVLGFEEWVDMQEIRRRVKEIFNVEYKNERSLYPYLKTMDDIGLMESTNVGGKRQWRKRDIIIKRKEQEEQAREKVETALAKRDVIALGPPQGAKPKKNSENSSGQNQ
ncbi:MAG: hypothetical protein JW744_01555 [Candidatus Diapherotrites archaeon]|uniref:Uncharacterized protein n=1 Tax=Candidatus Iainarchaeum sp. TaxID=3101447 RepID=A0A938YMX8_9ARCH|nr:hypothetical protein [Candidatus Diapherotrites archaeon]